MGLHKIENQGCLHKGKIQWPLEHIAEIEQENLRAIADKICQKNECRYPLLALRLLIHIITGIDTEDRIYISARQLSKALDAHYDTVTKCLKYLREIGVIRIEK